MDRLTFEVFTIVHGQQTDRNADDRPPLSWTYNSYAPNYKRIGI